MSNNGSKTINVNAEQWERMQALVTERRDISDVAKSVINAGLTNVEYRSVSNKIKAVAMKDPEIKALLKQKMAELK